MPNPFAHIELTTADLKAAQKFYSKVFGWKLKDVPGMNYTMIDVGGGTGGGMQLKPMPEAPTGWMPYVQVDDVKASVAKATKAGAMPLLPYQDIGEMGAIGVFSDPTGAVIGVWEMKQAPAPARPPRKRPPRRLLPRRPPPKRPLPRKRPPRKRPPRKRPPRRRLPRRRRRR